MNRTAKYVGDVKNGLMHGKGTYTYKDGSIFKGFWEKGVMHGKGTFTNAFYFSNETIDGKYVGEDEGPLTGVFKKGKPQGIFKWKRLLRRLDIEVKYLLAFWTETKLGIKSNGGIYQPLIFEVSETTLLMPINHDGCRWKYGTISQRAD